MSAKVEAAKLPAVMSPKELSREIDISIPGLARWRQTWPDGDRVGPAFSNPPGTNIVRYAGSDVAAWLNSSMSGAETEVPGAATPGANTNP